MAARPEHPAGADPVASDDQNHAHLTLEAPDTKTSDSGDASVSMDPDAAEKKPAMPGPGQTALLTGMITEL